MRFPWVITLAPGDAMALSPLRLEPELQIAETKSSLWLRGPAGQDALDAKLAALPACERFELIGADQLRLVDQRVPAHKLPMVSWQSLSAWLQVALPASALPGNLQPGIRLRLIRSSAEREPEVLFTTLDELRGFCGNAPQIRLDPLQFAADDKGHVLVRGHPLPPLPGKRFVLRGGVAVAAGYEWSPAVSDDVVARALGVAAGALVLWNADETVWRLHAEQFVPLTRSAIRATVTAQAGLE